MDTVGFFGLAATMLCTGVIIVSLLTGKVPARWPMPSLDRRNVPRGFWTMISIYAAGAMMGVLVGEQVHRLSA